MGAGILEQVIWSVPARSRSQSGGENIGWHDRRCAPVGARRQLDKLRARWRSRRRTPAGCP